MKITLSLVIALAAVPAHAQLYKWTDANGKVHYSDRPQDGAVAKEIAAQPPAQSAAAGDNWRQRELDSRERRLRHEQVNQDAARAAARNAPRAPYNPSADRSNKPLTDEEVCARDAQQIAYSEKGKNLTFVRGSGSSTATEEERQAIIRQRKENHALLCGPGQRAR